MISKVCYFYWENTKMSFLRYMTIKSWIHYNPDFETILITKHKKSGQRSSIYAECQDIDYFNGECYWKQCLELPITIQYLEDSYPEISKLRLEPQYTSDILTWYILSTNGGIVADTDILFTSPFDYDKYKDVDVSLFMYDNNFAIGFMFGTPNIIWKDLYTLALLANKKGYQDIGGILIRNYFLTYGNIQNLNIQLIDSSLVYPFVKKMTWQQSLDFPWKFNTIILDSTCGIHYYGGYPLTKEYNQKLTEHNYKEFNNTICENIGSILK